MFAHERIALYRSTGSTQITALDVRRDPMLACFGCRLLAVHLTGPSCPAGRSRPRGAACSTFGVYHPSDLSKQPALTIIDTLWRLVSAAGFPGAMAGN